MCVCLCCTTPNQKQVSNATYPTQMDMITVAGRRERISKSFHFTGSLSRSILLWCLIVQPTHPFNHFATIRRIPPTPPTPLNLASPAMWKNAAAFCGSNRPGMAVAATMGMVAPVTTLQQVTTLRSNDSETTALERSFSSTTNTSPTTTATNSNNASLISTSSRNPRAIVARATQVPSSKDVPTRQEQIQRLKSTHFDVFVVGGGCTGTGIALDGATRGLSTAMIERGDFGTETSSRSTKLIWAGIRYIATGFASLLRFRNLLRPIDAVKDFWGEYQMVQAAHRERKLLVDNNPHLINWVPIAIPIKEWISWPPPFGHPVFASAPITLPLVLKYYDAMSGFTCPPSHIMSVRRAQRKFPQLDEDVKYFQVFYEATHNDARTVTCIALTAAEEGAAVANHVEMIGLVKDETTGKAVGVKCRDNLTGEVFNARAKAIIFAGGPFTDELRKMESEQSKPAVAATAGTHIVLPGYYCPAGIGMLDLNTSDGRFLFFLPWQGHTIVGTTDRKGPAVSTPEPPEEEIRWILREVEKYLSPDLRVRRADVLSAWQGFRPLASDPHAPPDAPVSRDHIISTNPETGVTFITGGKWTTFRHMAKDVLDQVVKRHGLDHAGPCVTEKIPLRGGVGYTRNVPIQLVQEFGVSELTAKHLAQTYGMNAFEVCRMAEPTGEVWPRFGKKLLQTFPYLECEVEYACKKEMVCTLQDMLTLRMRIAYLNKEAALAVAPRVAELMAKSLGWSRREKQKQLDQAVEYISSFGGQYPKDGSAVVSTISDVRDLFNMFDANGNGYIDLTELKGAAKMIGFPFKNDDEAKKVFMRIDEDNDGRITEDEFVKWWNGKSQDTLKKNLGEKFLFSSSKAK